MAKHVRASTGSKEQAEAGVPARAPDGTPNFPPLPFTLPQVTVADKRRAAALLEALEAEYPDAHCELNYTNPHELLVATILSAQSTDVGVNKATPELFKAFPTPADYARSTPGSIEPYIRTIGLYRNKAKAIHAAMTEITHKFRGCVPQNMEDLLTLRGVARKTANVVLGNAFGINAGFVVDTHVQRLSTRMGLTARESRIPDIERKLMALIPRDKWCEASHLLIFHGRRACKARGVNCSQHEICAKFGVGCELRRGDRKQAGKSNHP